MKGPSYALLVCLFSSELADAYVICIMEIVHCLLPNQPWWQSTDDWFRDWFPVLYCTPSLINWECQVQADTILLGWNIFFFWAEKYHKCLDYCFGNIVSYCCFSPPWNCYLLCRNGAAWNRLKPHVSICFQPSEIIKVIVKIHKAKLYLV